MKRFRPLLLLLAIFSATLFFALIVSVSRAAEESHRAPYITLVVDSSEQMDEELAALSAAWEQVFSGTSTAPDQQSPTTHCDPLCPPLTATYSLLGFRDQFQLLGQTDSSAEMGDWLSRLFTADDGSCRDDMFGALQAAAHIAPSHHMTDVIVYPTTDSAPYGGRAALARTINLLAERNVAVNAVISDWCPDSALPLQAMRYLGAGTGGLPPRFAFSGVYTPAMTFALSEGTTPQLLDVKVGAGAQISDVHSVEVDASVELLDITVIAQLPCAHPYSPDSCGTTLTGDAEGLPTLNVVVRDPSGKPLHGENGVQVMEHEGVYYYHVNMEAFGGPRVGSFTVDIEGVNAGYFMSASASSGISFQVLTGHTVGKGPQRIVVGLLLPAVQFAARVPQPTEELFGAYNFKTGEMVPLNLRDDGMSGDGVAGDGIYGGIWEPAAGLWQIRVSGQSDDGSHFQRVEAAPVRVLQFDLSAPEKTQVMPGDNVRRLFTLHNDSTESETFELEVSSSQGWTVTGTVPGSLTLAAGESQMVEVLVQVPQEAPEGLVEETTLTALGSGDDPMQSHTVTAQTVVVDELRFYLPLLQWEEPDG